MVPHECKRLAEVDFPIAAVSQHAVREKQFPVPRGLPSTMHHWWARRPLASCRAMLLALLLPDPCDPHCPSVFKATARELLPPIPNCRPGADDAGLRKALLRFIADFANWNLAAHPDYLRVSRALVKAAHGDEAPLVVDPFAGGGSIPLEAMRVGCEAFASDLNPVACLILKVMLEDIPRRGPGLADALREAGAKLREAAARELADLYPKDPDGATPIAYLWARTVRCEAPNCGAEIPLMRSFWLASKSNRKRALRCRVERPEGAPPCVSFEVFEPKTGSEVRGSTVSRANATCPCCDSVLSAERVRTQLSEQRGGADAVFDDAGCRVAGARLTAVVTIKPGETGRHYRDPTQADLVAARRAQALLAGILDVWERDGRQGPRPVPDEPLPPIGTLGFRVQRYGMLRWGDLFTARQKLSLVLVANSIQTLCQTHETRPLAELLAFAIDKVADFNSSLAMWRASNEDVGHLFARQAVPISWDFIETNIAGKSYVGIERAINHVLDVVARISKVAPYPSSSQQADAANSPLPDQTAGVWFTDPPYYDAIPYSDLSDFFLVWLKRMLPGNPLLRDPFDPDNPLSPKAREAVQDETKTCDGRVKDRGFFEEVMGNTFAEGRRVLREDGIGSVVFAHKTTEGWEALLAGMIRGGWTVTGSWPIATESTTRMRARESAALATSVHLICRPRPENAPVGDWADVLRELPRRVADWMARLQGEGVRGADLVFACIGPALEIFSRCRAVETADGRQVGLAEYLEKVWEVVGRAALREVLGKTEAQASGDAAGVLEEDARLTALFLWTHQSTDAGDANRGRRGDDEDAAAKGLVLPFDVVRRFAQPMGIDLDLWTGSVISQSKGVVRLLPVAERRNYLLGDAGQGTAVGRIHADPLGGLQRTLFPAVDSVPKATPRRRADQIIAAGHTEIGEIGNRVATVLDRVHAAMLLQAAGKADALRASIKAEQERGPDFLRLANALSALYPRGGAEKRLLDAMLLAAPR